MSILDNKEEHEKVFGPSHNNEFGTPAPSDWTQLREKSSGEWHWFLKSEVTDPKFPSHEYDAE